MIVLITLMGVYACNSLIKRPSVQIEKGYKIPVVIDTLKAKWVNMTQEWLGEAWYLPICIVKYQDTIFVKEDWNQTNGNLYDERKRNYRKPTAKDILIRVDTNRHMSDYANIFLTDSGMIVIKMSEEAYPVIVTNISKDTLNIAHRLKISLILEAMDTNRLWKPIEVEFLPQYYHSPDFTALFLPPGEILISSVALKKGNFQTKLRLRFNQILSNEFKGSIYLTQFENEFD